MKGTLRLLTVIAALAMIVNLDAQQRLRLRLVGPPGSVDPETVGPSASITCPGGADVNVAAANPDQIQEAIDANPAGTIYCLGVGEHRLTTELVPKDGDTFIGEFGAILDGTGWTSSDVDDAAFKILTQNVDDVTIKNLTIRDMPQKGIHANGNSSAASWTIRNNDIGLCGNLAVSPPQDSTVSYNLLHDCTNGGYGMFRGSNTVWNNNEIYDNGGIPKFVATINTTFRDNYVHDNGGDGIWFDTSSIGSVIEDNIVENSGRHGIHLEITGSAITRRNTVTNSADTGILIVNSFEQDVYDNTLSGNFRGIRYLVKPAILDGVPKENLPDGYRQDENNVYDNSITILTSPANSWANGMNADPQGADIDDWLNSTPYVNTFENNDYVTFSGFNDWLWGSTVTFKTWTQWQALGHDTTGSCTGGGC